MIVIIFFSPEWRNVIPVFWNIEFSMLDLLLVFCATRFLCFWKSTTFYSSQLNVEHFTIGQQIFWQIFWSHTLLYWITYNRQIRSKTTFCFDWMSSLPITIRSFFNFGANFVWFTAVQRKRCGLFFSCVFIIFQILFDV